MTAATQNTFLLLQGPHGPFFHQLGKILRKAGSTVWRVSFNKGDENFWFDPASLIRYQGRPEEWPARVEALIHEKAITDLVVYGDTRPIHAQAIAAARAAGLRVHVFEEGYLRPYWVSYERNGSNGYSRLMDMSVAQMREALARLEIEHPDAPSRWGDTRHHIFYGALYHFFVLTRNRPYRKMQTHRAISVFAEFRLWLNRLLLLPMHMMERKIATARVKYSGFPYHLVLLQLEHDASFRMHSEFKSQTDFIDTVMAGFSKGAPTHHHLVFKAHPLEDGRAPIRKAIRDAADRHGLRERVHFVRGGKLAELLSQARSAVTVNSTSAQQALWRGLPVKCFGRAVFAKPEFTSSQEITDFFQAPNRPDARAYREYRHFLLETSQVPGGFYSARGRRALLRQVIDMMLALEDPYDALISGKAAPRQQLRVVK
ncbi:capsule biosynthesis protein CapA [Thioclava dalianensis]|uniref:Capsule biosynthesis protein CapA n=1 Tax=Thioclava dalianensis TaxID=1185766 RepID=A0A074TIF7_9RHOB|nr:capsule biosynthesis protein CapA [Thioclava dalianensis]KEP71429.1 capsule biosynthesis protein CapA [Thioclava dalianensis]SFM79796.1 capsular polysaccharide export protein [Thioclava dalianensis]